MKPSTKYSLSFNHFLILAIVAVLGFFPENVISAGSKVDVLPGFEGPLPFHLETGYIGVGESEEIQLFYYFVKSETNPKDDPVILWLSGEQGCSSLTGLVYEIGPLFFEAKVYNGTLPTLLLSGHSLTKWFSQNQDFVSNPFFIASSSYGGLIVPTIVELISDGNEAAKKPINLESLKESCKGEYVHVDSENKLCAQGLQKYNKLVDGICKQHILETCCGPEEPTPKLSLGARRALDEQRIRSFNEKFLYLDHDGSDDDDELICRVNYHRLSNYWANDPSVQKALHVRKVSSEKWVRCNWNTVSKSYKATIQDTRQQHAALNAKGYRSLINSKEQDVLVPPFKFEVYSEVGGYTRNFTSKMTYATVKGGGHIATEPWPDKCVALISRWIAGKDIATPPPSDPTALKQFMQYGKDMSSSTFSQLQALATAFPFIFS
nr:serine carboxypeptidase-like 11 isoform X1 [Ipomoea batatas]